MIIYDCRDSCWKKVDEAFVAYLAPEQWFKITKSPDALTRHFFDTDKGRVTILEGEGLDFDEQYSKLQERSKFVLRTEWQVPANLFDAACEHFKIER